MSNEGTKDLDKEGKTIKTHFINQRKETFKNRMGGRDISIFVVFFILVLIILTNLGHYFQRPFTCRIK